MFDWAKRKEKEEKEEGVEKLREMVGEDSDSDDALDRLLKSNT